MNPYDSYWADSLDALRDSPGWCSTGWRNYRRKVKWITMKSVSGDDFDIRMSFDSEDLIGLAPELIAEHAGPDKMTESSYTLGEGTGRGTVYTQTTDTYPWPNLTGNIDFEERRKLCNIAPGISWQLEPGLSDTAITQTTQWGNTNGTDLVVDESMLGEKVLDGGYHCWMSLPRDPRVALSDETTKNTIVSKAFPSDVLRNSNGYLLYINWIGHYIFAGAGNRGLTIQLQGTFEDSPNQNPADTIGTGADVNQWHYLLPELMEDQDPIMDWANPTDGKIIIINHSTFQGKYKHYRLVWFTEDDTGAEAHYHNGQFMPIALYPL